MSLEKTIKPTLNTIRSLCTEATYQRGRKYFEEGRVESIEAYEDSINAFVMGTHNYKVTIRLVGDLLSTCTCPYDGFGYCKHIVATLLTFIENHEGINKRKNKEEDQINTILYKTDIEEFKNYLKSLFKHDLKLRAQFLIHFSEKIGEKSIQDFEREIGMLFQGSASRYGYFDHTHQVDFTFIHDLARHYIIKRDHHETAKIYHAFSMVLASKIYLLDDSDGYYSEELRHAVNGLVTAIREGDMEFVKKQPYIDYLIGKVIVNDPTHSQNIFDHALRDICTSDQDLKHLKKLLTPYLPRNLPERGKNWGEYSHAKRLLMIQTFILHRLNDQTALTDLLRKHYRKDVDFCLLHAEQLESHNKVKKAIQVAEEGMKIFSIHDTIKLKKYLKKLYAANN